MGRVGDQPERRRVATSLRKQSTKRRDARSTSVEKKQSNQLSSSASIQLSLAEKIESNEKQPKNPEYWISKEINEGIKNIDEQNFSIVIETLQPTLDAEIDKLLKTGKYLKKGHDPKSNPDKNYVVFESIEKLDKLLKIDSQEVRKFCADIYLLIDKLTDAQTQYKKNSNKVPVHLRLMQAELTREGGNDNAVIGYCKEIINSGNEKFFANAYYLLAEAHSNSGNFNDAKTNIQLAWQFKSDVKIVSCDSRTIEMYKELATKINDKEQKPIEASWKGKENKGKERSLVEQSATENPMPYLKDEEPSSSGCSLQ